MGKKWVAVLLVVVAVGVVVFLVHVNGNSEGGSISMNSTKLWVWDGETVRGSSGKWVPYE